MIIPKRRTDSVSSGKLKDSELLLIITAAVFFVMYTCAVIFLGKGFLKPQTFCDILNENAALILISSGMTMVMITGGIDISVGAVVSLICTCCAVNLDISGGNIISSIFIALGTGLIFGLIQGFLIAYFEVQPFIITLAGMFLARGLTTIVNSNQFNVANKSFNKLKSLRIHLPGIGSYTRSGKFIQAYIEPGTVVALAAVIILFIFLRHIRTGREFYAVGGNPDNADMMGINVKKIRLVSHALCGLLTGIGGYVYFLHVGSCSPSHASGTEMNAIASSIIGGTLLSGGSGNIIGTLFGVLSLSTIRNIVSSIGLDDAWWSNITAASMLCIFIVLQSLVLSGRKHK